MFVLFLVLALTAGIANADLIGHWQLDDGDPCTTAVDSVAGLNGTLGGTPLPAWIDGTPGGLNPTAALDFSSDTAEVATAGSSLMSGLSAFTITAWVKQSETQTQWAGIVQYRDGSGLEAALEINPAHGSVVRVAGVAASGFGYSEGSTAVPIGVWTHIAGTYDGSTLKTYVNGMLDSQSAGNATSGALRDNDRPVYIGRNPGNGISFKGGIDDVRIYNEALGSNYIMVLASPTCQNVRYAGLSLIADLSGPEGEPDCYVDLYDFAAFAANWLTGGAP